MEAKKILVVSHSFYPQNTPRAFRTTELVKEFCRQGHDVTLYTHVDERHHQPLAKEFGIKFKDLGPMRFSQFDITKGPRILRLVKRAVNRSLLLFFDFPLIELMFKVKKCLKKESGYHLMVSIAVPHPVHWGVAWARTAKNAIAGVWVADCGDPYMGAVIHDSFRKMKYFKYFEKWFCRKADYISIPVLSTRESYYPEFQHKIVEIPQGFRFEDVSVVKSTPQNSVPTFAFAGIFMRLSRNPAPLLEYLVAKNKDFKFIVYTRTPQLLIPFKTLLKEKLEIREFIPRLELLTELSKVDFLINIGFDPAHHIPSKLIDYYLTGRPTLCFPTSEVDTVALEEFLAGNYSRAFEYNDIDKYRIENVCRKFLDLVH